MQHWKTQIQSFDSRRDLIIPGNKDETTRFCIEQWLTIAQEAIEKRGAFFVALSGGSTPKAIYVGLAQEPYRNQLDWTKVWLFWSDERSVPLDDPESNYKMALDSGFATLPIPKEQIFRMEAERDIEENASKYEKLIEEKIPDAAFDLVMLGMGGDGHTASLFPKTHGLHPTPPRLVVANCVPKLDTWRMSFTYKALNQGRNISIYVLGDSKAEQVKQVLLGESNPDLYPIQSVGTADHKATWILDTGAAALLS